MSRPLLILGAIFIGIGFILRSSWLTISPPGFYVDEASIAENAYQILTTGKDEWGIRWPVYFKAFGEYKNPIFIYSVVIVFKLVGVSFYSVRLTAGLWGIATVLVLGYWGYCLKRSWNGAILTGLIATYLPWHFHASRVAFEAITMPFFMSLFVLGWWKLIQKFRYPWLWFTVTVNAVMFYSYTSARLVTVMNLILLCICWVKKLRWQTFTLPLLTLVILLPAIIWNYLYPGSLLARFNVTGYDLNNINSYLGIAATYVHQWSPNLWLFKGDGNLRHSPGVGLLPWVCIGTILAFLYTLRRPGYSRWITVMILLAPLPAALTNTTPNALRMIHLIPLLVICIVLGIQQLNQKKWSHTLASITIGLYLYYSGTFLIGYFREFPYRAQWWFDAPYVAALPVVASQSRPVTIHHYLIGSGHLQASLFYRHMYHLLFTETIHFDSDVAHVLPNSINVYFGDDCYLSRFHNLRHVDQYKGYCLVEAN